MNDSEEWVVWNGSLGVLDQARMGRVEEAPSGRIAWLAAPYDVVGPFSLDELENFGRVRFGACLVMSRRIWKADQDKLRSETRERLWALAMGVNAPNDASAHRARLELPPWGALTAAEINAAFRRLAKTVHPDAGGRHDDYIRLTEARDALLERATSMN
ncbi:J domain-containing protein [uncultured Rhodoblastus sp.]|uniref:J domain-containing protein n=1 Tax=uncultured Rhodoblastus sp. TaxID=543037 RepID=UPI0025D84891|nr:J domain-containing protein [uncultured Rhodoblastus sp.]